MFTDITGEDAYAVLDVQLSSKASEQNVNELHALSDGHYDFYDRMAQNKDYTQNTYFMFCLFVYGFLAVITLITVIHTVNSISMSVSARTKQYGVMRAVGMDDLQIKKMISMETSYIYDIRTFCRLRSGSAPALFFLYSDDYRLLGNPMAASFSIRCRNTGAACDRFTSCTVSSGKAHL